MVDINPYFVISPHKSSPGVDEGDLGDLPEMIRVLFLSLSLSLSLSALDRLLLRQQSHLENI